MVLRWPLPLPLRLLLRHLRAPELGVRTCKVEALAARYLRAPELGARVREVGPLAARCLCGLRGVGG